MNAIDESVISACILAGEGIHGQGSDILVPTHFYLVMASLLVFCGAVSFSYECVRSELFFFCEEWEEREHE